MDVRALPRWDVLFFRPDVSGPALSIEPLGRSPDHAPHSSERYCCVRSERDRDGNVHHHAERVSDCNHGSQHRSDDWHDNVRLDVGGKCGRITGILHTTLSDLLLHESERCQDRKGQGCKGL